MMKYIILLLVTNTCFVFQVFGQATLSPGSQTYRQVEAALQHLYDTKIDEAKQLAEQVRAKLPDHPVYPLLQALAIRAAYYPVDPASEQFSTMRDYLYDALDKAERMLQKNDEQPEANFFALISYGLLAMYENEDGNTLKAVGLAKDAYQYMKRGFALQEKYPEFYFSSGLYNYYREKYPELHPVYKPFVWVFKSGDMQLGLEQLQKASQQSTIMRAEATYYLSHIYLRYEGQSKVSRQYATALVNAHPDNLHFVSLYIDASIASHQYQTLGTYVAKLVKSDRKYYQMLGLLFTAMLLEKKDKEWDKAAQHYTKSLAISNNLDGDGIANYRSYAYAGLARIALHSKKPQQAEKLYKQALASAQYPQTAKEAEEYLE